MKLSIVIPVYNEESTIEEVLAQVIAVELRDGLEKEIVVVDDGSTDGSLEAIHKTQLAQGELVKVHASPINFGKGAAVRLGFRFATGDIILIQDADLELSPQEYNRLLAPILAGEAEVVYGSRFRQNNPRIPLRARVANRFLTWLTNGLFRGRITDMETAYKVFRAEVLQQFRLKRVSFDFEPEITAKILKAGYHIHEIPIAYNPRTSYEGKKIRWQDGVEAIWTLLACRFFE